MEEEKRLPVKVSRLFLIDLNSIFQYGVGPLASSKPNFMRMRFGS